jgi:hypothetical protein
MTGMLARPGRPFTTLFVCLLVAIVVRPLLDYNQVGHTIFATAMIVFFVAAIGILCRARHERWAALAFGLIWLGARLPALFVANPNIRIEVIGRIAEIAFLSLIVTLLAAAVLRKPTVTLDNILGAFTGYLLIAVIWGIGYSLIELNEPGSFRVNDALQSEWASPAERDWVLNYFSCCTLMTVGYGDVTPVHAAARTLAVLEAMTGQLYLAVLVAVLVGIQVAQRFIREPDADSE